MSRTSKLLDLIMVCSLAAFASPASAQSSSTETMLIPELGLSAVCYSSPYEQGWDETVESHRYILLVKGSEGLSGQINYVDAPVEYRMVVKGYPCYYRYQSFRFSGMGTALDTSLPSPEPIQVDGKEYPSAFPRQQLTPLVRRLLENCETTSPWGSFPWDAIFQQECADQVSDVLIGETTAIYIANDPNQPSKSIPVVFVHGMPFYNGARIKPW